MRTYFPGRGTIVEESYLSGAIAGWAASRAACILWVLEERRVYVSAHARDRILSCTDPGTLSRWLDRATTVDSTYELIGPDPERSKTARGATAAEETD